MTRFAGQLVRVERGVGTASLQNYASYSYGLNGERTGVTDGAAVHQLNRVVGQLERRGIDSRSLSNGTICAMFASASIGARLNFLTPEAGTYPSPPAAVQRVRSFRIPILQ